MTEQAKFLPSVVGLIYDWLRFEDYLGNVGLYHRVGKMLCQTRELDATDQANGLIKNLAR